MSLVKKVLRKLTRVLRDCDRISLVAFNSEAQQLCPLTFCDYAGKIALQEKIEGLKGSGLTNISAGFLKGLQVFEERESKNSASCLILFSDGEDTCNSKPFETSVEKLSALSEVSRPSIHCLGFGSEVDTSTLEALALEGHGRFYAVNLLDSLEFAFAAIVAVIHSKVATDISVSVSQNESEICCSIPRVFSKDGSTTFLLPSLAANDRKDLVFLIRAERKRIEGVVMCAPVSVTASYKDNSGKPYKKVVPVNVEFRPWRRGERASIDPSVYVHLYRVLTATCITEARALAESGDFRAASMKLCFATNILEAVPNPEEPVTHLLKDLEKAQELLQSQAHWEAGGAPQFASLSYSHYNQSASVEAAQYTTRQQDNMFSKFTAQQEEDP